jgi:hypothetical protein
MSQHDMTVDNGAGVAVRADINLALKALASQSSGASAPSPTYPAQVWADTGTGRLRQRDAANTIWVDKGPIDGAMAPLDSPIFTGVVQGQLPSIIGDVRNGRMSIPTASATATFTADELVVGTALGGFTYKLSNYSKLINLATTGAGGMDTGTAPTSGWVALYAIYNPATGTSSILATNATSTVAPTVYAGANMPSGYTASALISVWRITGANVFYAGFQTGNQVIFLGLSALNVTATQASMTAFSISVGAPPNAKTVFGSFSAVATAAAVLGCGISPSSTSLGSQSGQISCSNAAQHVGQFNAVIITSQTLYYTFTATSGSSPNLTVTIVGFTF